VAEKAHSSRAIRAHLRTRGVGSVNAEPDEQRAHCKGIASSGGRPHRLRRAQLHRTRLQRLKTVARAAPKYDQHAIRYRGGLSLAAVLLWLTDLGDTS
jgi:hypothetical protein